ncbi:MAG: Outer membrane protein assembly factor BamA [candidate division TM6 bacterium GW2011_GWF2_28_16]|nr:MAG: Outer membrane protein assembly factor BamA [candidate division TM6 bacterium GW2011_GWF2_28_16]
MAKVKFFLLFLNIYFFVFAQETFLKENSCWILKKVAVKGVPFGKYNFLSLYKMQQGDVFDISEHEEAVKNIKILLKNKGYFNCSVQEEFIYDKKNKTILVNIFIKKNEKFLINKVYFDLKIDNSKKLELNIIKNLENRFYSKSLLSRYIKKIIKYCKLNGFTNPKISIKKIINNYSKKIDLTFNVILGKKQKLEFIGNQFFTSRDIKEKLFGLNYPAWAFTPEIIAQELFNYYYNVGYWNAVIFYKKLLDGAYLFNIKENEPVFVNKILLKDENNNLLQDNMSLNSTKNLEKRIFSQKVLDENLNNIMNYYYKNGFWNFKIINKKLKKNKKDNTCDVFINVNMGQQRLFSDTLLPVDLSYIQEQKIVILKKLQKEGYWYANVYPEIKQELIDKKLMVKISWNIKKGEQIKFGDITLGGYTKVAPKKILKELSFRKNDIWDAKKIDETRKNLKKLDIFKSVLIEPEKISESKTTGFVPVKLKVIDDDPISASFRFGYFLTNKNFLFKRESTYKLGGSLIFKNPTNNLDKLSLDADFTRFERKFNLEYKILSPFGISIKDSKLVGKANIYFNKFINPVAVQNSQSAYQAIENGFLFGFNNEFKHDYFARLNFGNEWIKTEKVRGNINLDSKYINRTVPYFFVEPTIIVKKINSELDIKKGSISFGSLKFMVPEYTGKPIGKLTFEQSVFAPIYKQVIFAARLRLGYILNSKFNTIEPSQRFFLGGPYSVRGYDKDALPPYGIDYYLDDKNVLKTRYTIQGGSGMLNGNLELRFPVYKNFKGVIFQDLGVLSQTGLPGFSGKWYPSTGFGLRYNTPLGAIRFDLGFKWKDVLPNDTKYGWYLTLGEVF